MSEPMTRDELRADMKRYAEDLTAKTGVDIDFEEMWAEAVARMAPESRARMGIDPPAVGR